MVIICATIIIICVCICVTICHVKKLDYHYYQNFHQLQLFKHGVDDIISNINSKELTNVINVRDELIHLNTIA